MNLANLLERRAILTPTAPAVFVGTTLHSTYGQLATAAFALAHAFTTSFGLATGSRIALLMGNRAEYLECLYACWTAGMVAVPINAKLHASEAAHILATSGAAVLVADAALVPPAELLARDAPELVHVVEADSPAYRGLLGAGCMRPVAVDGHALAWLFYTSGTTGRPKGAMQTHRNLWSMTQTYFSDVDAASAHDAILYAAPISHGAGMYNFAHVLVGARHVIPESGGFEAQEMFALARHHGRVSAFAAPTMIRRLVDWGEQSGQAPDGFKTLVYGGGPMYVADIQRALRVMGPRFVQIYGQGECPMTITALSREQIADAGHPDWAQRVGSVGVPQSSVRVRVVDEQGSEVPAGDLGEIVVSGDAVMKGYWRDEAATAAALRDGWLYTGDMGVMDTAGFLTLKDRSKDVIISGGSNIYPREVEEVLLKHPRVAEVSVVGRPNNEWGEEVVAVVATRDGAVVDTCELDALCLQSIARFKRPKAYHFLASLPKNSYGKVLKRELRDLVDAS